MGFRGLCAPGAVVRCAAGAVNMAGSIAIANIAEAATTVITEIHIFAAIVRCAAAITTA